MYRGFALQALQLPDFVPHVVLSLPVVPRAASWDLPATCLEKPILPAARDAQAHPAAGCPPRCRA